MRVFARPNGSGKTTIIKSLQQKILFGVYVNVDDIESLLKEYNELLFSAWQLNIHQTLLLPIFHSFKTFLGNTFKNASYQHYVPMLLHIYIVINDQKRFNRPRDAR